MSKGGGRRGPPKQNAAPSEDTSFIIFGDGKSDKKAKSKQAKAGSSNLAPQAEGVPKKPDTRQIIGGASWTGKLPVNLLSEHCQKQKWEKPEYTMVGSGASKSPNLIMNSPKKRKASFLVLS